MSWERHFNLIRKNSLAVNQKAPTFVKKGQKSKERVMGKKKKKKKRERGNGGWTTYDVVVGPPQKEDGIKLVKIRQIEEILIITCTKKVHPFSLHYIDYPDLKSYGPYVLCNAPEGACILCQAGKPITKKLITPVFPIEAGCIQFLPISTSLEPLALLP